MDKRDGGSVFNACTISANFSEIYFWPSIRTVEVEVDEIFCKSQYK